MITGGIPQTPEDVDASWLTSALQERHPGAVVSAIELLATTDLTNSHARMAVTYEHRAGAPETMFCKLLPRDPQRRGAIAQSGMGRREALFYGRLAPKVQMRVPTVHVVGYDEHDGSFVLMLEDLPSSGCTVSDGTWGVTADQAAAALDDLAQLHATYEDAGARAAEAAWVPAARAGSSYGSTLLQYGLDHHRDRLTSSFATLAQLYIGHGEAFTPLWTQGPSTIIHGDPHIGNLFFDHGRTGFLDWGLINVGSPMRDVSYFLTMAMATEDRRTHERDLLRTYLEARNARGAVAIPFDDAWRQHRLQAAYTVPACCQVVTFPEDATERRKVFAAAFLARAEAALDDLEVVAAVRESTGLSS